MADPDTSLSIGICAHNEEETIGPLLRQVTAADIGCEEIIVVVAGDDRTADIVRKHADRDRRITIIEEDRRRGQTAAQNRILKEATGNHLALIDGDGTVKPGSLETIIGRMDGSRLIYGREVPLPRPTMLGRMNDVLWQLHHELCEDQPKFSTQLAVLPADLIEEIPEDIVLDDEYIGVVAREEGYDIEYCPEAVKHHNAPDSFRAFLSQRRKNWAGRMQIRDRGRENLQSTAARAKHFVKRFFSRPYGESLIMIPIGLVEATAFLLASCDRLRGRWPTIWYR